MGLYRFSKGKRNYNVRHILLLAMLTFCSGSHSCNCFIAASQNSQGEQRRHSTRSVKRRKFDDELVESSLNNKQEKMTKAVIKSSLSTDTTTAAEPSPKAVKVMTL